MKQLIIGICGPSNSGKSSLVQNLSKKYHAEHIEVDHYLKDKDQIPFLNNYRNWELPENHKFNDLLKDLQDLKNNKAINHPIYSFKEGKAKGYRKVKPKTIFVEGFYIFYDKRIRDLLDLKIYLKISKKELIKRRICTEEEYEWTQREYLNKVVIPMFEKYGIQQEKYADFVIDANKPLDKVEKEVIRIIEDKFPKIFK